MENKTGKYLKYAIGEVVLVVIGILIALSINNWNDDRKSNKEEVLILINLLDNLNQVQKQSENNIDSELKLKSTLLYLLNYNSNKIELIKPVKLDSIFNVGLWSLASEPPVINAYSDLKNTDKIGLIKNKKLKEKFTDLEISLGKLKEMMADRSSVQQIRIDKIAERDVNFVYLSKFNIPELNIEKEIQNNFDLILNDPIIRNLLAIKLRMTKDVHEYYKSLELEIIDLITLLEKEVNLKK